MDAIAFPTYFMQLDVPFIFVGMVVCIIGRAVYTSFHTKGRCARKSAMTTPHKELEFVPPLEAEEVDTSRTEPGAEPDAEPSAAEAGTPKSSAPIGRWNRWNRLAVAFAILALAYPAMHQLLHQFVVIEIPSVSNSAPPVPETIQLAEKPSLVDLAVEQRSQRGTAGDLPVDFSGQPDAKTIQSAETQIGTLPASDHRKDNFPGTGEHHPLALGAINGLADDIEASSAMSDVEQPSYEDEDDEDLWMEDGSDCFGGEPALIVKLTREIVEINHKTNYVKSDYHGTILVGSPGLPMTVVFDTGSGHLLIPSMYCKTEACRVHTRYRRSGSSTGKDINFNGSDVVRGLPRDSMTVEFGTGEATGVVVEDIICMGERTGAIVDASLWKGNDGLKPGCMRMHFLAATDLSEEPFAKFGFDGVFGLSLLGLSQTPQHNFLTVLSHLIKDRHQCASQAFGVFLAKNEHEESDIAFGGWNEGHLLEELSWAPVHDPSLGHWIIPIKSMRVDDEVLDFCNDGQCRAAVDTGTALLSVPPKIFRELFELLRHESDLSGHCQGHGPMLHFEFEDFTLTLSPKEYSAARRPKQSMMSDPDFEEDPAANDTTVSRRRDLRCFPLLMTLELEEPLGPKLFILGETVLRKYYTVYDARLKRIGFGRAVHTSAPSRDELLLHAPELDGIGLKELNKKRRRTNPTMFDIYRWRQALKVPPGLRKTP